MTNIYYCDECLHVYHKIPESNSCLICKNELSLENEINDLDYLVCETCYSLYTPQKSEQIIPEEKETGEGAKFLCKCVNHCPPNTLFERVSENEQIFLVGSIVLADYYQCQNCKAIYFWNRERAQKDCIECKASLVFPMNYNPKNYTALYRCANPNHGIRLKARDLILNHNEEIQNNLKHENVPELENQLRNQYQEKVNQIQSQGGLFKKEKKKKEKLREVGEWAKSERKKLYSGLETKALRCSVYKIEKVNGTDKAVKTTDGCDSLAHIRLRKIIQADNQSTMFGAAPEKESGSKDINISDLETMDKIKTYKPSIADFGNIEDVFSESVEQDIKSKILEDQKTIEKSVEGSDNKKINEEDNIISEESNLASDGQIKDKLEEIKLDVEIPDITIQKLPKLKNDQLYLVFELLDGDLNRIPGKFGILPISIKKDNFIIKIGRDEIAKSYWKNVNEIKKLLPAFNNISKSQFLIKKEATNYKIIVPDAVTNKLFQKSSKDDELLQIKDEVMIDRTLNTFFLHIFNYIHEYILKVRIITPEI